MQGLLENEAFRIYMICSAVLALNSIALANFTALTRGRRKIMLNAEDAKLSKEATIVEIEHPDVARVQRAHRNAVENLLVFFPIGLIYALTAPSALGAKAYFFTFTAARWLHSIFYLKSIQPWRTAIFVVSLLCLVGMIVHVLRVALA